MFQFSSTPFRVAGLDDIHDVFELYGMTGAAIR
jgi:hypothetical protein